VTASPWLRQTLANVLGRDVQVTDEPEASAKGAALLALGTIPQPATIQIVHPDPSAVEAELAARARQQDLAGRLGYEPRGFDPSWQPITRPRSDRERGP
jgi:sugar (pentulose or hexulose) kinase